VLGDIFGQKEKLRKSEYFITKVLSYRNRNLSLLFVCFIFKNECLHLSTKMHFQLKKKEIFAHNNIFDIFEWNQF
jgi:hypothetical protein